MFIRSRLAPTGAVGLPFLVLIGHSLNVIQGKTDVAMLTVLRVISQHLNRSAPPGNMAAAVERDKFKIIYVCVWSWTTRCAD